jgi:hypothetical protein
MCVEALVASSSVDGHDVGAFVENFLSGEYFKACELLERGCDLHWKRVKCQLKEHRRAARPNDRLSTSGSFQNTHAGRFNLGPTWTDTGPAIRRAPEIKGSRRSAFRSTVSCAGACAEPHVGRRRGAIYIEHGGRP